MKNVFETAFTSIVEQIHGLGKKLVLASVSLSIIILAAFTAINEANASFSLSARLTLRAGGYVSASVIDPGAGFDADPEP